MKRRKKQNKKGRQQKAGSGLDLWKKVGYVPRKPSKREIHRKSYESRMNLPEGKGTNRSEGSNKRLEWLLHRR